MGKVFLAASVEEADIVVAWLHDRGVDAFVKNRHSATVFASLATTPKGVEVVVLDAMQADRAKQLLSEHADQLNQSGPSLPRGKVFRAVCEDCGRATDFPSELFGSVQTCPHCRANMDATDDPRVC